MERKVSCYRLSGPLADDLSVALQAGKVPELHIQYNVVLVGESGGVNDAHNAMMTITLSLGETAVVKSVSQNFSIQRVFAVASEESHVSRVPLGTLDLIEKAVRSGLAELVPELAGEINQAKVTTYTVNAIGSSETHLVSVTLRFSIAPRLGSKNTRGKRKFNDEDILSADAMADKGLICMGSDTVRATLECTRVFFNWYLWRLLRRQRGLNRQQNV